MIYNNKKKQNKNHTYSQSFFILCYLDSSLISGVGGYEELFEMLLVNLEVLEWAGFREC